VFGGEGAVVAGPAKETPLSPEKNTATEAPSADPCAQPSPKAEIALLDDFEDGDNKLFKAFQREGWWFSASDNTEGSSVSPLKFLAEKLPDADGTKENAYAVHFTAAGQKDWGAVWGTTLHWESKGIKCPFNASAFAGIRFRARGPGSMRVTLAIPETMPPDAGGTCPSKCYDSYGKVVRLSSCWDDYLVRWDQLQQGGWGNEARFEPARLIQLAFTARIEDLPADFWIDDLTLVTQEQATAMTAAAPSLAKANASCTAANPSVAAKAAPAKGAKPAHAPSAPAKPPASAAPADARPR
jgi:hypothetical protein